MGLYQLRAFDDEWNIVKELESEDMEIATEISDFKKFGVKPRNIYSRQLLKIISKPIHSSFLEAMLFSGADIETIAQKAQMSERLIELYKTLFFETDEFLSKLDKIEYFQSLLTEYRPGDGEYTKGVLLRGAFQYGWKYISVKFSMESNNDDNVKMMDIIARSAFYRWHDDTLEHKNKNTFYRDTKDTIKILESVIKSKEGTEQEKSTDLIEEIKEANEKFSEEPKIVVLPIYNPDKGDFEVQNNADAPIDVELEPNNQIEKK